MSVKTIIKLELLADSDGTFGARWSGDISEGGTWDHPDLSSLFAELNDIFDRSAKR